MPNPFAPLKDALQILSDHADVLPATGQAVVDMVNPDIGEIYDQQTSGNATVKDCFETSPSRLYRNVHPISRTEEHRLRYFVNGSTKTYFIGTILEGENSSPVQLSQVGAAMLQRQEDGHMRVERSQQKILLTLDKSRLSDELWAAVDRAIDKSGKFELQDGAETREKNAYAGISQEPRARGAHRANWYMRELEMELARTVPRASNDWLLLDGSVGNEFENWQGAPLIGVAKTFRRDSRFDIGRGPRAKKLNLYSLLKDLNENQRTIVFSRDDEGKIVYWYVRIRPKQGLDYLLMGVVKVEMPNPTQERVDSEWIDQVSGWIIAERSVTPYGRDSRWHAHLYPVYLAEQVAQSLFYSEAVLKSGIWPLAATTEVQF